jgi:hypothetical protein
MYWSSKENVALQADPTNLNNILAIYGVQSGATSNTNSANQVGPTFNRVIKETSNR